MTRQARLGLVVLIGLLSAVRIMFVIGSQNSLVADTFGVLLIVMLSKWLFEQGSAENSEEESANDRS